METGMIPFEKMPCCIDPAEQGPSSPPTTRVMENGEHYFSTDCMARRIAPSAASGSALAELQKATVEDMASIHRDTVQRHCARIPRPDSQCCR